MFSFFFLQNQDIISLNQKDLQLVNYMILS